MHRMSLWRMCREVSLPGTLFLLSGPVLDRERSTDVFPAQILAVSRSSMGREADDTTGEKKKRKDYNRAHLTFLSPSPLR